MGFFTNYEKNSYLFTDKEIQLLKELFKLVEDSLLFSKKPSELIDSVKVKWAANMLVEEDSTFGLWTYMKKDVIYLRPEPDHCVADRLNHIYSNIKAENSIKIYEKRPTFADVVYSHVKSLDHQLMSCLLHLIDMNGHMTVTVLHELWHRQQYIKSPLTYILSCLATNLINYEKACQQKWSIEYDVRQYVDTDKMHAKVALISENIREYFDLLNQIENTSTTEIQKSILIEKANNVLNPAYASLLSILKKETKNEK